MADPMSVEEPSYVHPFKDRVVRRNWLDIIEYLEDDEFIPYADWIQVAKDEAFDVLCEEGLESEYAQEYIHWVRKLREEELWLNRRKNHVAHQATHAQTRAGKTSNVRMR